MIRDVSKNDLKSIIKIYLIILIPLVIGAFILIDYIRDLEIDTTKKLILSEQEQKIDTVEYIIKTEMESKTEDLMVIKDSEEMDNFINLKSNYYKEKLQGLFLRIAKNKKEFDLIRFIDNEGHEVIRINNYRGRDPYIVEENQLQNKEGRYYFQYAEDLKDDQIYISPFDLNSEKGEIQIPYKPTIRFATPIFNSQGDREGVLIINYHGENVLDVFEEYSRENNIINTYLVNKEGYYFTEGFGETFGFMFEDKQDENLQSHNPILWNNIENDKKFDELINIKGESYIVEPLNLFDEDKIISTDNQWYAISSFNDKDIPILSKDSIINIDNLHFYVLFILSLILFVIVALYYYSSKNKEGFETIKMVSNSNDGVFITDSEYRIIYLNDAFLAMSGYEDLELLGKNIELLKSKRHKQDFYRQIHKKVNTDGLWKGRIWNKRKDGMIFSSTMTLIADRDSKSKNVKNYVGILSELGHKKERKEISEILINPNGSILTDREYFLEELIERSIAEEDSLALVYVYIKNNSILEITYNKKAYNEVMALLYEKIKKLIGERNFLVKMTNDEYLFELRGVEEKKEIGDFMKNFFDDMAKPVIFKNKEVFFDIKCGVSLYPENGTKARDLVTNAEVAYSVLNDESFDYQIYHKTSKEKLIYERKIHDKIKFAVKNKELFVSFQPQVDTRTGRVIGGEALLRWNTEELGAVPPHIFIPIAEKNGAIIEIGYYVIEETFKIIKRLQDYCDTIIPISINISPEQFKYRGLVEGFIKHKNKYKIDYRYIKIEITEGMLIGSKGKINKKLKEFKDLGMNISIDDFGTGFSSLSYLKNLSVDELKIDREFIKNIPDKDDGSIAQAVTNLGQNLNKKIIAEGVETEEQIKFLKSIGCYNVQGYYYSRPLEGEKFIKYACEKNN